MKKRLLSFLLAIILSVMLLPAQTYAAESTPLMETTGEATDSAVQYIGGNDAAALAAAVTLPEERNISISNINWSLSTIDGQTITKSTYADKTVLMVFYRSTLNNGVATCYNSRSLISQLAQSSWISANDIQIVAVDSYGNSADDVKAFKEKYAPNCDDIVFTYGNTNNLIWTFARLHNLNSLYFCYCTVIKNDTLCYAWDYCTSATPCQYALSTVSSVANPYAPAPAGYLNSGSYALTKLSKGEIVQLLKDNPLTLPSNVFVTEPSCVAPYATGTVKTEALQAATDRLTALRRIAGLPGVTLDAALSENAQYGAVILGAIGGLSHYPSQPSDMSDSFYQQAFEATSTSNLYAGRTLTTAVDGFMDDSDSSNVDRLGHRRWQLNPTMGKVGFGFATNNQTLYRSYVVEKVFDYSGSRFDYEFIGWPASGYFPSDLSGFTKNTAWSVSLNPDRYQTPNQSAIKVTLVRESDGKTWTFSGSDYFETGSGEYFHVDTDSYGGSPAIIFRPDGITSYEGLYTVSIEGLEYIWGDKVTSFTYQVDFFNTANYSDNTLVTPKLTDVSNETTGVKITWGAVSGAEKYRVYYKTGSGSWTALADVTGTSYTWTGAKSGTNYSFTVQCISSDGKSTTSDYDNTGKSITYIAAPQISALTSETTGVKITWGAVSGAENYRVYYKTGSGSWMKIADVAGTSYTWTGAKSGTNYSFTVRCVSSDGKITTSGFDSNGKSITYATPELKTPVLTAVSNETTGVKITWGAVSGAEKYRVYYKTGSGSWTKIADVAGTSYTWTGAKSGTKYTFTVRCVSSDGKNTTSGFDSTGKSITYIAAPKISTLTNEATGVKITWGAVSGAEKYRVYYKTGSGSWTKIADMTGTSYTWNEAKSGTKYTFTVRCISNDGKSTTSGFDSTGKSITYTASSLSTPVLTAVSNEATGVKITWGAVNGAEKYRVYYKIGSGSWTKIADVTGTSYTWNGAESGTNYSFTVKCISSDGKSTTSGFDSTGKNITYIAAPQISALTNESTGVKITWGAVSGAEKYRVYYKTGSGSWTKIAEVTGTSYTWTGAKNGTNYTFTVRCITSDGKSTTSGFDSTGKSITYTATGSASNLATPVLTAVTNSATGVKITWGTVSGAEKYRVYYKNSSGGWTKIADVTGTSYTWTGAESGNHYTFTVRCISSDGKSTTSSFDSTGKSITYIAAPQISALTNEANGVKITWGAVSGAESYRVYYKNSSGGWTKIADVTGTSYIWTEAKSGTNYTFTVRCISSDGKDTISSFDSTGKSITYIGVQ